MHASLLWGMQLKASVKWKSLCVQVANAPHLPVHLGAMSEAVKFQVSSSLQIPPVQNDRMHTWQGEARIQTEGYRWLWMRAVICQQLLQLKIKVAIETLVYRLIWDFLRSSQGLVFDSQKLCRSSITQKVMPRMRVWKKAMCLWLITHSWQEAPTSQTSLSSLLSSMRARSFFL